MVERTVFGLRRDTSMRGMGISGKKVDQWSMLQMWRVLMRFTNLIIPLVVKAEAYDTFECADCRLPAVSVTVS